MIGMGNRMIQFSVRFRHDDRKESLGGEDGEGGARWLNAVNTQVTIEPGTIFRIRALVQYQGSGSFSPQFRLTRAVNGGSMLLVSPTSAVVKTVDTIYYNSQSNTTDFVGRIGGGTWADTSNGCRVGADDRTGSTLTFAASTQIEIENAIMIIGDDVNEGDNIIFEHRVVGSGAFSNGYNNRGDIIVGVARENKIVARNSALHINNGIVRIGS